jgi:hypothetical protein
MKHEVRERRNERVRSLKIIARSRDQGGEKINRQG